MRIVVAPDSFKGSLSAPRVAAALARGLQAGWAALRVVQVPVADGGEGTVDALVRATAGRFVTTEVTGPLGEPIRARWGILGDGAGGVRTAVIETAAASGLSLIPPARRDAGRTTTRGTGELVRAALDAGCRRIIVGLGGSATNDGGVGMATALGARFSDADGRALPPGGAPLARLAHIDTGALDARLKSTEIIGAVDVDNPLTGPAGASVVFGPQKGASPAEVAALDKSLAHYAALVGQHVGRNVADVAGAGAAGGLGAGLFAFCNATIRPGASIVLKAVGLEQHVATADVVITGEGRVDGQSLHGKAPMAVVALARGRMKPVIVVAGSFGPGAEKLHDAGVTATVPVVDGPMSLQKAMKNAEPLLEATGRRVGRLLRLGSRHGTREDDPHE